jgi:hypothetical protein
LDIGCYTKKTNDWLLARYTDTSSKCWWQSVTVKFNFAFVMDGDVI